MAEKEPIKQDTNIQQGKKLDPQKGEAENPTSKELTKEEKSMNDDNKKADLKNDNIKKEDVKKGDSKKEDETNESTTKNDTKKDGINKDNSKKDDPTKSDAKKNLSKKGNVPIDNVKEQVPKIPFPKSIYLYMGAYIFFSFGFNLRNSVTLLFYADYAKMGERKGKTVKHSLLYVGTILYPLGAMLGDDYLGYFKTMVIASSVLLPAWYIVPIVSISTLNLPEIPLIYFGVILVSVANGLWTPCLLPYIGDQFVLPQQKKDYQWYLMTIYFINNIILTLALLIGPHIRSSVHCFGREDCYAAVLFLSAITYTIFYSILLGGNKIFKKSPPNKNNVTMKLIRLICYAIKEKRKSTDKKKSLLDYGEDKFDKQFIADAKRLKMLWVFIPRIIFAALVFQEQSAWVFQARRMDGDIGFYMIQPDQLYIINGIFCLIMIPIFQYGIFPLLTKWNLLKKPLSRICTGGVMYAIGYILCGVISLQLEKDFHPIPKNHEGQIRIYNTMNCELTLKANIFEEDVIIPELKFYDNYKLDVDGEMIVPINYTCGRLRGQDQLVLFEKELHGFYFKKDGKLESFQENVEREKTGRPTVITLLNSKSPVKYKYTISDYLAAESSSEIIKPLITKAGKYKLYIDENENELFTKQFKLGGVYVVAIYEAVEGNFTYNVNEAHPPNSIHMLWLTPEYFVDVIGEVMYSIAYQEFAYTQAPLSMKAFVNIFLVFTDTLGNFLVSALESIFAMKMSSNFFCYSVLMLVTVAIMGFFSAKYKYETEKNKVGEELEGDKKDT